MSSHPVVKLERISDKTECSWLGGNNSGVSFPEANIASVIYQRSLVRHYVNDTGSFVTQVEEVSFWRYSLSSSSWRSVATPKSYWSAEPPALIKPSFLRFFHPTSSSLNALYRPLTISMSSSPSLSRSFICVRSRSHLFPSFHVSHLWSFLWTIHAGR